jgi:hypothetical protein
MAEIALTRPGGYKTDRLRAYQIHIDGKRVGEIRPGKTEVFEVPSGRHALQLKQDWTSSEKLQVDLDADDRLQFVCAPKVKENGVTMMIGLRMIYWSTLGFRRYIDLRHGAELAAASEQKSWMLLNGPKLFGIALLIGITWWALTGQSIAVVGVVVAAMALVVGGLVGRAIGTTAVQATEEVQERRRDR